MGTTFATVDDILDFAIKGEEEAAAFYGDLAKRVDKPWMKDVFAGFAREEEGHKAKLLGVKKGKTLAPAKDKVKDLKIGDYLVDVDTGDPATLDYQQALVIAMKKEKAAFKLYIDLASKATDAGLRELLTGLAEEEAKHKLRFEIEYDEFVLKDN